MGERWVSFRSYFDGRRRIPFASQMGMILIVRRTDVGGRGTSFVRSSYVDWMLHHPVLG